MNFAPFKAVWTKTPSFVKWSLLALLLAAGSFAAGRYSGPAKVIEHTVVDESTSQKLKETAAELATLKTSYAALEQVKQKVVTETKYVNNKVTVADSNTKCSEDFDRKTGKLYHRVCERVTSVTDTETTTKLAAVTSERDTLKSTLATTESENSRLRLVEQDFETYKRTEKDRTVINETKPGWRVGAAALIEPSTTLELKDVEFGVTLERRLAWDLYLGVTAVPQAGLYGLSLSLGF